MHYLVRLIKPRFGRTGLSVLTALLLVAGVLGPAAMGHSADAAPLADPPGNNGTVKIDGFVLDNTHSPNNEPHVTCSLAVDFYGFDANSAFGYVTFEVQAPTGSGTLISSDAVALDGDDNSGGGSAEGFDGNKVYDLTDALSSYTAHSQQGYHIKLTVAVPDGNVQGAYSKYKVFWVEPCVDDTTGTDTTGTDTTGTDTTGTDTTGTDTTGTETTGTDTTGTETTGTDTTTGGEETTTGGEETTGDDTTGTDTTGTETTTGGEESTTGVDTTGTDSTGGEETTTGGEETTTGGEETTTTGEETTTGGEETTTGDEQTTTGGEETTTGDEQTTTTGDEQGTTTGGENTTTGDDQRTGGGEDKQTDDDDDQQTGGGEDKQTSGGDDQQGTSTGDEQADDDDQQTTNGGGEGEQPEEMPVMGGGATAGLMTGGALAVAGMVLYFGSLTALAGTILRRKR